MHEINSTSIIGGFTLGSLSFLFGDFSMLFKVLIALIILDFITGIIGAIYNKTISSQIGLKGILKKVLIFIIIAVAFLLQKLLPEQTPLRDIVMMFYVVNESISILENVSKIESFPIPEKIKNILLQLRKEIDDEEASENSRKD